MLVVVVAAVVMMVITAMTGDTTTLLDRKLGSGTESKKKWHCPLCLNTVKGLGF